MTQQSILLKLESAVDIAKTALSGLTEDTSVARGMIEATERVLYSEINRIAKCENHERERGLNLNAVITVCDSCLQASCWQGIFYCDRSRGAGITTKSVRELVALGREHSDYWKSDPDYRD